jgi:hypothetical protein
MQTTVNATHRKRLARALAAELGIGYLPALDQVTKAAASGRLPSRLDEAGMAAALRILTTHDALAVTAPPRLATHITVQQTLEQLPNRRKASDPRDQQIFDLSAVYEAWTGKQGLLYISSPGGGKDKYVFGSASGGGHVCLGREEALTHITGLVNNTTPPPLPSEAQEGDAADSDADRFHLEKPYLALLRQVWQGRVSLEVVQATPRSVTTHFAVGNIRVGDKQEIELRWLLGNDYITHPPLLVGEEWAVVKTTEFGDEVLAFHGADVDQFHDGLPSQRRRTGPRAFTIRRSDIARCPIKSMAVEHYRVDGSCRCLPDPVFEDAVRAHAKAPTFTVRTKSEALALERTGAWQAEAFDDDGDPITMHLPRTLPPQRVTWRDLDPATDRLMGGPTTTKVYDSHDRRVNATCDVCNRRLANGEPWWMVHSPDRNWESNAGVACISHRPDLLPLRTVGNTLDETTGDSTDETAAPSPSVDFEHTEEEYEAARTAGHKAFDPRANADRAARAAAQTVHAARPDERGSHCAVCMQRVKRVPGGRGPTWIHSESGAVAAAGGDPQHPLNQP